MGKLTENKIKLKNKNYFDYSHYNEKKSYLDILLVYFSEFMISGHGGLDALAVVFRKPILYTNFTPIGNWFTFYKYSIHTFKDHYSQKLNKFLSIKEIFDLNLAMCFRTNIFLENKIILIEN